MDWIKEAAASLIPNRFEEGHERVVDFNHRLLD
jgi:hypothetical protein